MDQEDPLTHPEVAQGRHTERRRTERRHIENHTPDQSLDTLDTIILDTDRQQSELHTSGGSIAQIHIGPSTGTEVDGEQAV